MKVLTHSIAFASTLLAAPCADAQNYFQRSTLFEHTDPNAQLERPTETADGGVLSLLRTDTSLCLVKQDGNGDPLWAKQYPSDATDPEWKIERMSATSDGGALMVQDLWEWEDQPNTSSYHIVLTRIDGSGIILWSKLYVLEMGGWGGVLIEAELITGPGDEHTVALHAYSYASSAVLLRLDDTGNVLWCRRFATGYPDYLKMELLTDSSHGAAVVMHHSWHTSHPISVLRFTQTGSYLWGRRVMVVNPTCIYPSANGLAMSGNIAAGEDYFYVHGRQKSLPLQFNFLLKFDDIGSLMWYRLYGDGLLNPWYCGPGSELSTGDIQFGVRQRQYFGTNGLHFGGGSRMSPSAIIGNSTYDRIGITARSVLPGFLESGSFRRTDQFNVIWSTPTVERISWDLTNTCDWYVDTTYARTDSLLPMTSIQIDTVPTPIPQLVTVNDTTTVAVPVNLSSFFDFCAIVGIHENIAFDQPILEVFPSLIAAGDPLRLRTSDAAEVTILDARGRIVWRERVNSSLTNVPTSGLASGLHLVQAIDGQGTALGSARFVVE